MTTQSLARRRLTGRLTVGLPPDQAFRLFTPRGEQDWVPGWLPRFPATADDDSVPGTVFETTAHDQTTTWVVADRTWGRHIRYVRVVPQISAGTVTVTLDDAGDRTEVTVAYELTALTPAGGERVREFADGYPAFLQTWQDAIAASIRRASS
jgi:hypothetical protein